MAKRPKLIEERPPCDPDSFNTSGVVIIMDRGNPISDIYTANIAIDLNSEPSWPQHLRYERQRRVRQGKKVTPLPENALRPDLVVIPGPDASVEVIVNQLRRLIKRIEEIGLFTGRDEEGDHIFEKLSGK